MNDVVEQSVHSENGHNQPSGAWIRSQFQENPTKEVSESLLGGVNEIEAGDEADDNDAKTTREELADSLRGLAAALSKATEIPVRALQHTWTEKFRSLESNFSSRNAALDEATTALASLNTSVGRIEENLTEREGGQERVAGEMQELRARFDGLEADLRQQLGEISSSIEQLHNEIVVQKTKVQTLQQEGDRRTEVVALVSQVLDSLKSSVNPLGESSEIEAN